MGVGSERDRHLALAGALEQQLGGVDFAAILPETGGVEFDGHTGGLRRPQKCIVERGAILFRADAEFLGEIGVADDIEETRGGGLGQGAEIDGPDFEGIVLAPFRELAGVVDGPVFGDVMDGADEVIPGMAGGEVADPILLAG